MMWMKFNIIITKIFTFYYYYLLYFNWLTYYYQVNGYT